MSRPKTKPRSLFRRLLYFLVLVTGGGAGVGGWALKDHPRAQALWTLIGGDPAPGQASDGDCPLLSGVADALKPVDPFREPGTYQVTVSTVQLDPTLFKPGHTVDIQAKLHRLGSRGTDETLWETKQYGERLAVVGRDELTAGWPHRPFQVEWNTGDQLVLEVYDAKPALFTQAQKFTLITPDSEGPVFPLKTGDFPLEPSRRPERPIDPRINHVVLKSQRIGAAHAQGQGPTQVAERPIVIK
jgi:hypothetical protein